MLAPNYSIYTEMPLSMKVYNTFRSRWCGAYLQSKGIKVIPTIAWGEPNTFWFCFDGIDQGSVVAISTVGVRKEKSLFMQGYNELIRKIKPKAVICYGDPFDEMQGKVIPIDYAKTNNLYKRNTIGAEKIFYGYVEQVKGMGRAGIGRKISLPKNDSQLKHIFRKKAGHLKDTPENRVLLEQTANNENNYIGSDAFGNQWYSQMLSDSKQIWVEVRNDTIQNGGINSPPRYWNNQTGFNNRKGEIVSYE